jgi:hypothetical protein
MVRRPVMLTLLLTVQTGCPHAWGRDGTIEEALERDMDAYYSMKDCALDAEAWKNSCMNFHQEKNDPAAQRRCPLECRPEEP